MGDSHPTQSREDTKPLNRRLCKELTEVAKPPGVIPGTTVSLQSDSGSCPLHESLVFDSCLWDGLRRGQAGTPRSFVGTLRVRVFVSFQL